MSTTFEGKTIKWSDDKGKKADKQQENLIEPKGETKGTPSQTGLKDRIEGLGLWYPPL